MTDVSNRVQALRLFGERHLDPAAVAAPIVPLAPCPTGSGPLALPAPAEVEAQLAALAAVAALKAKGNACARLSVCRCAPNQRKFAVSSHVPFVAECTHQADSLLFDCLDSANGLVLYLVGAPSDLNPEIPLVRGLTSAMPRTAQSWTQHRTLIPVLALPAEPWPAK